VGLAVKVEILYCAWNRLAYTKATLELLRRNTDWSKVTRLTVYDDGSEDGTREFLEGNEIGAYVPAYELRHGGWHSTGATMNDFIALTEADYFVKIDNDIAMPPGWLPILLAVSERHPEYELLGMEAGWSGRYEGIRHRNRYTALPARHIGGVGLMRTSAFTHRRPVPLSLGKNGRAGFTIWQHRYRPKAGWLKPDLPNVQLDKIPTEPWATLSAYYCEQGWSRPWDPYTDDMKGWWEWLPEDVIPVVSRKIRSSSSRI
jgi:glycosyltransferase involved in cell wall biosynthesis